MVAKVQTDAAQLACPQAHATHVIEASSQTAGQWKDCEGALDPRKAKAEFERHEQLVDAELAKMHTQA